MPLGTFKGEIFSLRFILELDKTLIITLRLILLKIQPSIVQILLKDNLDTKLEEQNTLVS